MSDYHESVLGEYVHSVEFKKETIQITLRLTQTYNHGDLSWNVSDSSVMDHGSPVEVDYDTILEAKQAFSRRICELLGLPVSNEQDD